VAYLVRVLGGGNQPSWNSPKKRRVGKEIKGPLKALIMLAYQKNSSLSFREIIAYDPSYQVSDFAIALRLPF